MRNGAKCLQVNGLRQPTGAGFDLEPGKDFAEPRTCSSRKIVLSGDSIRG